MRPIIQEIQTSHTPESLVEQLAGEPGIILLRSAMFDSAHAHYSFVTARPFLEFRSSGSRCETINDIPHIQFGNPWHVLDGLMSRYELLDEIDLPFPLGGCFGYWGYDLKNFVEPKLPRTAVNDLELPDCHVGFYDSLVVFDHRLSKTWIISTGLQADGSRTETRAHDRLRWWQDVVSQVSKPAVSQASEPATLSVESNLTREDFITNVRQAQDYIHHGHIYQVNLSHRLAADWPNSGVGLVPQFARSLPCSILRLSRLRRVFKSAHPHPNYFYVSAATHIQTRPIKGTRPRSTIPSVMPN